MLHLGIISGLIATQKVQLGTNLTYNWTTGNGTDVGDGLIIMDLCADIIGHSSLTHNLL